MENTTTIEKVRGLMGPSDFERRYLCPGSLREESKLPPLPSGKYADRGIKLHVIVEGAIGHMIRGEKFDLTQFGLSDDDLFQVEETIRILNENLNIIDGEDNVYFEYQTKLQFLGFDEGRGKIDMVVINDERKEVWIIDFKFGDMWTEEPRLNWQLKCYAVAMHNELGYSDITTVIIQPEHKKQWREQGYTFNYLQEVENEITRAMELCHSEDAKLVPGEKQCQWCRAKNTCPARQNALMTIPSHISFSEYIKGLDAFGLAELYEKAQIGKKLCSDWIDEIERGTIAGEYEMTGYSVGNGRGRREWNNPEAALPILEQLCAEKGKSPELLMTKPELISPGQVEKLLGKSIPVQAALKPLVEQAPGGPKIYKQESK